MNLIYNLMGSKSSRLIEQLTGAGFSVEQAQGFLPDALKSVMGGLQQADVQNLLNTDSNIQTSSLMEKIDITALASCLDNDSSLTRHGLQAIIPQVLDFLKDHPAIANLLGGKDHSETSTGIFH